MIDTQLTADEFWSMMTFCSPSICCIYAVLTFVLAAHARLFNHFCHPCSHSIAPAVRFDMDHLSLANSILGPEASASSGAFQTQEAPASPLKITKLSLSGA